MTRFLLAAEADQIQDTIFRATHLREVVGGSQLLARFCEEAPKALDSGKYKSKIEVVVNDGGSFRILVEGIEREAREFGAYLAEMYRLTLDRSLTVAKPVEQTGDFRAANREAGAQLRRAKRRASGAAISPQFPFMALCATCGLGLATEHASRHDDDQPNYLCGSCRRKTLERKTNSYGPFLGPFYKDVGEQINQLDQEGIQFSQDTVEAAQEVKCNPRRAIEDGRRHPDKGIKFPEDTEHVAPYDPRRYVAYLLADVNNMGRIFDMCKTEEQLRNLSLALPKVIRESLAHPTARMMTKEVVRWSKRSPRFFPVLPLILGGDDLFALLPAPWAIDTALQLCQQFNSKIEEAFQESSLASLAQSSEFALPTISACVVICKSNYPFYLAHEAGHQRLAEAKRLTKALRQQNKEDTKASALTFELILGSQLAPEASSQDYRPTLRPYFTISVPEGWGLPAQSLLDQRLRLDGLGGKRQAELRELFDSRNILGPDLTNWIALRDKVLGRIQRMSGEEEGMYEKVKRGMEDLSGKNGWLRVNRPLDSVIWHGSGVPDLLDLWDFTLRLDVPL